MISIRNLNKTHHNRGENKVKALTDVNIDFDETGITFISGASGNGKSTLMALIGGIDKYSQGEILVDGRDLKTLTPRELDSYRNSYVDFIIQENTLISSLTVAENVRLEKSIHGQYASNEDVNAALDIVGLSGYGDRMPAEISGGEKKRVAIARTMLMDVKVVLVDEPTASLDTQNADIVWSVLKKYAENHLVIAVSHNEEEKQKYADRIITLDKGVVVDDKRLTKKSKEAAKKTEELVAANEKKTKKAKVTEDITTIQKSNLGAKQTVKLAYSYMSSRKVSFAFVTILSCFALLFFSVFFILSGYNYNKVLAYSVKESDTPYVAFVNGTTDHSAPITEEMSDSIIDSLRKDSLPIFNSFKDLAEVNFAVSFGQGFYTSSAQNFSVRGLLEVEGDVGEYNSIGQEILSGAYPTAGNEAVISDYFAELILRYGAEIYDGSSTFMSGESLAGTADDPYANIIGKAIVTNYGAIKVSGVYGTDYKRFVAEEDLSFRGYNSEEYAFKLRYIYSVIHTNSDFISAYAQEHNTANNLIATIEKDGANVINTTNFTATTIEGSAKTFYIKTGKTLAEVSSNDIIISTNLYNTITANLAGYTPIDVNTLSGNTVDFGVSPETSANLSLEITLNNGQTKTYTIVGVFIEDIAATDTKIYFTRTRFIKDILSVTTFSASTKVLYTQVGNATIEKVINSLEDTGLNYVSINSEFVNNYGEKMKIMSSAFLIASIFIAIYTLVLMYYFISQIIVDKKSDIGILKTLGCGTKDIVSIFVLCGLAIGFLVFLSAVLLTFVISAIANVVIISQIPVTIAVFSTSGLMYLWIALICIAVVAFGTFIPIRKYSKLPPKELLKIF